MSILSKISGSFDAYTRSFGEKLSRGSQVRDAHRTKHLVHAEVGTPPVRTEVAFSFEDGAFVFRGLCACPDAIAKAGKCAHVYALLHYTQWEWHNLHHNPLWNGRILVRPPASLDPADKRPDFVKALDSIISTEDMPQWDGSPATVASVGPLAYVLTHGRHRNDQLALELHHLKTSPKNPGASPVPGKHVKLSTEHILALENEADRQACAVLFGAGDNDDYLGYGSDRASSTWYVRPATLGILLPTLSRTGRLFWKPFDGQPFPVRWLDQTFSEIIHLNRADSAGGGSSEKYRFAVGLERRAPGVARGQGEPVGLSNGFEDFKVLLDESPGLLLVGDQLALFDGGEVWLNRGLLAALPPFELTERDALMLLRELNSRGISARTIWPDGWQVPERRDVVPKPLLTLRAQGDNLPASTILGSVSFAYDSGKIDAHARDPLVVSPTPTGEQVIHRNTPVEAQLLSQLISLGGKYEPYQKSWSFKASIVPVLINALVGADWEVAGTQGLYRRPGNFTLSVASGIDWFDLHGRVDYAPGLSADIASVLKAMASGERFVKLGDGSVGILPEAWLAKEARWMSLGKVDDDKVRFSKSQLAVIDAMLMAMPEVTCDAQLSTARSRLAEFDQIRPIAEPASFNGKLRPYQQEGMGWLSFLEEFGFGGCLADDMGLGKTIQLLAHLASRREQNAAGGPWLVVAPKSVTGNWIREAEKFAPDLKVLNYTAGQRPKSDLDSYDLIVTSYGIMRLDIATLKKLTFGCVVLDEAQVIKNAGSQVAKAARLLSAKRRLALTGTPVENRMEDLWSIFDFLNPGMLGTIKGFRLAIEKNEDGTDSYETLRRALRPFILRRTKKVVARELPDRIEQTIRCELSGKQKEIYQGLKNHYRDLILGKIDKDGLAKSQMHILEALLRLRQAACHTGLLPGADAVATAATELAPAMPAKKSSRKKLPAPDTITMDASALATLPEPISMSGISAKMDTLIPMISEVVAEDHKVLIFSQFTSMLDLVEPHLKLAQIPFERLDGSTSQKARDAAVARFQTSKDSSVFLISLKAGGVGLNLTAAEYVFLLDPWWNPAVEAQAIDRSHRIGQQNRVIAYRLIAADTVEDRILELQSKKRDLAEAIISGAEGPLKQLTREDLAWLLG